MSETLNKTSEWPKVSVIIPYKVDRGYLEDAIDSVMTQHYEGEVELIRSKSDGTVGVNLNTGIDLATGDLITYLCDDDLLPPDAIAHSAAPFMVDPLIDFIHGNCENFDTVTGNVVTYVPRCEHPVLADLLARNHIHGGTVMYRKQFFEKFGKYDPLLQTGEEFEMHLRALSQGARIGYVPHVLYRYRLHGLQKHRRYLLPDGDDRAHHINAFKSKYYGK